MSFEERFKIEKELQRMDLSIKNLEKEMIKKKDELEKIIFEETYGYNRDKFLEELSALCEKYSYKIKGDTCGDVCFVNDHGIVIGYLEDD